MSKTPTHRITQNWTTKKSIAIALLTACTASNANADSATIIKHRKGIMEAIGGHFTASFSTIRGGEFSENQSYHAESIARLAKVAANTFDFDSKSFSRNMLLTFRARIRPDTASQGQQDYAGLPWWHATRTRCRHSSPPDPHHTRGPWWCHRLGCSA